METKTLRNGYKIPSIGFGTWRVPEGDTTFDAVTEALKVGYRHIDTAKRYENEKSVGEAIKASGINRDEIFVTSKLWNTDRGYDNAMRAFEKTLHDLDLEYLDLYLLHWPAVKNQFDNWEEINLSSWKALTELYNEGVIKAIGVSNFYPHHLKALMETEVLPMVNQIEFHPGFMQTETLNYCRENGILVEAWAPFAAGKILENPDLVKLASKYNKSVAQLCIRWCLQNDVVPLPKSITPERILQNLQVFDFEITDEDMAYLNAMDYIGGSGHNSDEVKF